MSQFLTPTDIPDAEYRGLWSGHTVKWDFGGRQVFAQTDKGVRGINVPIRFRVEDNRIVENSIETEPATGANLADEPLVIHAIEGTNLGAMAEELVMNTPHDRHDDLHWFLERALHILNAE